MVAIKKIDPLMYTKEKAVRGEIKGIRDGKYFSLPAFRLVTGHNVILIFANLDDADAVVESIAILISPASLGKVVVLPRDDALVEGFYKNVYNSATEGTFKVSHDPAGNTFYGTLDVSFDDPNATLHKLEDCIFSIQS